MHPAIRILCFLILIVFLARTDLHVLPVYLVAFAIVAAKNILFIIKSVGPFLVRLRWFWLSIMLLYAVMVPGDPVIKITADLGLTRAGLLEGFERCVSLLLVLLYFSLFNAYTDKSAWTAGIFWLLKPLRIFGVHIEKLSLRLAMTMQAVNDLQQERKKIRNGISVLSDWKQIPDRIATVFTHVLSRAEQQESREYIFEHEPVRLYQWIFPVSLCGLLWLVNFLFLVY